jgi:enoyl-CoA hydratase
MSKLLAEIRGRVLLVTLNRPAVRNAVDAETARALYETFRAFDADGAADAAVLTGAGGNFCAGADLHAIARGEMNPLTKDGSAPMGPTRLQLSKPVIAAIEGYAVAGGLELAAWCDLRVAARDATLGIFSRRLGVPLIDMGTIRLPRLIGMSRALDLILTGRGVSGDEGLAIGLVNRLTEPGRALDAALALAQQLTEFPQQCLRGDRASAYAQWDLTWRDAQANEFRSGMAVLASGETLAGAQRFLQGIGRHGKFSEDG